MKYLIDTHYLLWALFEPKKVDESVGTIFASEESVKYVSVISLWEISLKYSIGKLDLEGIYPDELPPVIQESGFKITNLSPEVFSSYHRLPKKRDHKDPFDRMLIWQAIHNDYVFVTKDERIEAYQEDGLKLAAGR